MVRIHPMVVSFLWITISCLKDGTDAFKLYQMNEKCGQYVYADVAGEVRFNADFSGHRYLNNVDSKIECTLTLHAPLQWRHFQFEFEYYRPGKHSTECLSIQQGSTKKYQWPVKGTSKKYCYSRPSMNHAFTTESAKDLILTVNGTYTSRLVFHMRYHLFQADSSCLDYKCDNLRCIPDEVNCNGNNPCGDGSDCRKEGLTPLAILGVVLGALGAMAICICCLMSQRAQRDKTIAERGTEMADATTALATQPVNDQHGPHFSGTQFDSQGREIPQPSAPYGNHESPSTLSFASYAQSTRDEDVWPYPGYRSLDRPNRAGSRNGSSYISDFHNRPHVYAPFMERQFSSAHNFPGSSVNDTLMTSQTSAARAMSYTHVNNTSSPGRSYAHGRIGSNRHINVFEGGDTGGESNTSAPPPSYDYVIGHADQYKISKDSTGVAAT